MTARPPVEAVPAGLRTPGSAGAPAPHPGVALAQLTVRSIRRGTLVVTLVAAGMSAIVVASYDAVVGQAPDGAASLAVLAANPAIRTLFGEPVGLDSPGGFTVWRTGTALAVILGVWAALTATRLLRGEEEAGRATLLMAGRLRGSTAVTVVLAVLTGTLALIGGAVAVAMILAGATAGPTLLHAAGLALTAVFFAGAGAAAAQVAGSRSGASGATVGLLLVMQLARMVGDGVDGLGWLRLLSPFGLTALDAPFSTDRIGPVLLLAAAAGLMLAVAPLLATRRDLGDGLLHRLGRRHSHLALLGSVTGFATRTTLRPLVGWAVGLGAYFLLIGSLTTSLTGFLQQNPMFTGLAMKAGFGGLDTTGGFAATLFALLPVPVGTFATVRIAELAHDETSRRLGLLLAAPLSRARLLATHAAVTTAAVAVLTAAAGTAMWAGTAAVDADLGLTDALAGAANTLPVSLLGAGFALVGLGLSPRLVIALGVLPGTGGFLLQVIGQSVDAPRWILRISPFAHLAPVPAAPASVVSSSVMATIALAAALVGVTAHRRRDMHVG